MARKLCDVVIVISFFCLYVFLGYLTNAYGIFAIPFAICGCILILGFVDEAFTKTTLYVDRIETTDALGNKFVFRREDVAVRGWKNAGRSSSPALFSEGYEKSFVLPSNIPVDDAWRAWMDATAPKLELGWFKWFIPNVLK